MLAAGPGIGLQELALETIHCGVFAQSAYAGTYKGLWFDVLVASSEGSLLQDITPVYKAHGYVKKQDHQMVNVRLMLVYQ